MLFQVDSISKGGSRLCFSQQIPLGRYLHHSNNSEENGSGNVGFVALTPMIPARTVSLLRFCKKVEKEGSVVAVVEVSDPNQERGDFNTLPLGVLLEKMGEGRTKVTWVKHSEVARSLMGNGAFSSGRWLGLLKQKLLESRMNTFCILDTLVPTLVKRMVEDVVRIISPTVPDGWSQIPS